MDIYAPSGFPGARTWPTGTPVHDTTNKCAHGGGPCTVKEVGIGIYKNILYTKRPPQIKYPETFSEVLGKWGYTWMWEDMQSAGDHGWLKAMIRKNTLEVVMDGSYMQALYPNMNSCAFILECLQGRGHLMGDFSKQTMAMCSYQKENS